MIRDTGIEINRSDTLFIDLEIPHTQFENTDGIFERAATLGVQHQICTNGGSLRQNDSIQFEFSTVRFDGVCPGRGFVTPGGLKLSAFRFVKREATQLHDLILETGLSGQSPERLAVSLKIGRGHAEIRGRVLNCSRNRCSNINIAICGNFGLTKRRKDAVYWSIRHFGTGVESRTPSR